MSINSNYFKLGSVATALFVGSSNLPNYTYNGIAVTDIGSNTDYLVIQCLGGSTGSQQIILPPNASNWVFIKNATPYSVTVGTSGNLNVNVVSGEIAALFNDGTQYNKVQIGTLNLNFNSYSNTSTLSPSSEFLVQTGSTINNITWSQLQALLGLGTSTLLVAAACSTSNITLAGTQTIDGYAAPVGSLILANGQSTASQNGLYVVAAGVWTRAASLAAASSAANTCIAVKFGTQNSGLWINTNTPGSDVVGTSALSWQTSTFTASNGVTLTSGHALVGTNYDYVINSVATLRAATTEGSGSSATTIHLLSGSYLITGNTGVPASSGRINISGLTLVVSSGVNVQITGTTYNEGFYNGQLSVAQGAVCQLDNLTWTNNTATNSIITTASSNMSINNCILAGGTELIFDGGECFVNYTQFGDSAAPESSNQQILVNVNTTVDANLYQGVLHVHGCNFIGGATAISTQISPTYSLKRLDVQNCKLQCTSYSIQINNDTQSILISNNTFIGTHQSIYFYSNSYLSSTYALIKGNSFEDTIAPIYIYGGIVLASLIAQDNQLINTIHMVETSPTAYDKDAQPVGVLRLVNNRTSTGGGGYYLPNCIPGTYTAGSATVTSAIDVRNLLDFDSVQKSVVGAFTSGTPVAGVPHEITTIQQNAIAVDNNNSSSGYGHVYVTNPITSGKFSLVFDVPNNGTSTTNILFKPFQLDTTHNVYMGMMHIYSIPRTTTDTAITPCYARTPFICSYNGGFCIASSSNGSYRLPANDLPVDSSWGAHPYTYWWNSDSGATSPFHQLQMGLGQLDGAGNLLVDLNSTLASGIPTITITLPGLGGSVSGSTNRWVILKFEYEAIRSDASE